MNLVQFDSQEVQEVDGSFWYHDASAALYSLSSSYDTVEYKLTERFG